MSQRCVNVDSEKEGWSEGLLTGMMTCRCGCMGGSADEGQAPEPVA